MSSFRIFDKLGGKDAVLDVLAARTGKKRRTDRAIRKWRQDRKLPYWAIVELMRECKDRGLRFSDQDCTLPAKEREVA
jgi:hypothetical protein